MAQLKIIRVYRTKRGVEPFNTWLDSLKDKKTIARIERRVDRLEEGHYGDYKWVGEGVFEMRLFFGAGYRVYFAEDGDTIILILCGGDKNSQSRDIERAKRYWRSYREDSR